MIGLEHIVKVYHGTYKKLAEKLGISSPTIMGWLSKKRPIPKSKLKALSEMFRIDEEYFYKELSEVEKIEIEIEYLNRLSKRKSTYIPDIIQDNEGNQHEVMTLVDPYEHDIRVKYEELALQKLLLRLKGVLYNESFLSEFTLQKHFDLLNDICVSLEEDNYFELTNQGIEVRKSIPKVSALETLMHVLNNRNKLAFGSSKEDAFTLEMEALLHKYNLLSQDHELGIKEDPFFKDAEGN